jgi:hypothetical protein
VSEEQVSGRACVWCGSQLTIESAVPLDEHMTDIDASHALSGVRAWPRGCRDCVGDRAHRGLFVHGSTCDLCRDEQTADECVVGRGLFHLVRETSRHVIFAIPCEPCTLARMFPRQAPKHECTGLAAMSDGTVPCPCCRSTPPPSCARCRRPIETGEKFDVQLAQSASGGAGATNYQHKKCPPCQPVAGSDVHESAMREPAQPLPARSGDPTVTATVTRSDTRSPATTGQRGLNRARLFLGFRERSQADLHQWRRRSR